MTKEKITKEFIIKYLKEYYEKYNKTPIARDKEHPFSDRTVANKFGTWNDALILANIPLLRNNPVQVKCNHCKKEFTKLFNQYKKSENHFCSRSCCAKYNNSIRIRSEETNNKTRLALQKSHNCSICETIINGGQRKTCSRKCMKQLNINNGKISGKKAGKASAASQQRRSKNEILCSELCIEYFGQDDIQLNEQIFKDTNGNFWDCDIFIKSLKMAILWDGLYWHYGPNVSKKQKARDALKRKIIVDNGCEYYTIIDKGKFNKEFVEEQFNLFLHRLNFKKVLNDLIKVNE
jgi:hypothetical protein